MSYAIFNAGSFSSTQSSLLEISWVITASISCWAAVVPPTPLVKPVKLVAVLPVYAINSLPILKKPLLSKSAVESTVKVVPVDVNCDATSVLLCDKPRLSTLSNKLISVDAITDLLSLLYAPLLIPVKVVAVLPV